MKTYASFFKIKFINGLQYRAAAFAGIATQLGWGFMTIFMYYAFYQTSANNFPMKFSDLSTYIWLQQAFFCLFVAWIFEHEIFNSITSGNVAYELCRPIDIYDMWFAKSAADRVAKTALRCLPVLFIGALQRHPFGLSLPKNIQAFFLFLVSLSLGFLLLLSFNMLIYISTFYTISPIGIRILSISVMEFFSGAVIMLPFLPDRLGRIIGLLPFASIQNTPFLIYVGYISNKDALYAILLQLFWLLLLICTGKMLIKHALKKVIVQGG